MRNENKQLDSQWFRDKALLPSKKNLNFTIQSSPIDFEEEQKSKRIP
jgi:hypothetical protein